MSAHRLSASELLERMSVVQVHPTPPFKIDAAWRHVYVQGVYDRRVSVYAQQVRALNLIHALATVEREDLRLREGSRIAVVGGGFGGVTVAAAGALAGFHMTLLEERPDLLWLQAGCMTRELHPRIYDWPDPDCMRRDTHNLGVLPWEARPAGEVVTQILEGFAAIRERLAPLLPKPWTGVRNVTIRPGRQVAWNPGHHNETFDAIVLAVGWGPEKGVDDTNFFSYWRDNPLAQFTIGDAHDVLISGTGDGGLIDCIRACVPGFIHHTFVEKSGLNPDKVPAVADLAEELRRIERDALAAADADAMRKVVTRRYEDLESDLADQALKLGAPARRRVVLNGMSADPLGLDSARLHRFLVSRLLRADRVDYRAGELPLPTRGPSGWRVSIDGREDTFAQVVLRHGGQLPLKTQFPHIDKLAEPRLRAHEWEDLTRVPIWGDGLWPHIAGRAPVASPVQAYREWRKWLRAARRDCLGQPWRRDARVPLTVEAIGRYAEGGGVEPGAARLDATSLVEPGARWIVRGESGVGKTTLLEQLEDFVLDASTRVPVRIRLVDLIAGTGTYLNLLELQAVAHNAGCRGVASSIADEMRHASVVLLLDEMDQVGGADWDAVRATIDGLARAWPRLTIVLTDRPGIERSIPGFGLARVQELDAALQRDLLAALVEPPVADRVLAEIHRQPDLASLSRIPLFLRFIAEDVSHSHSDAGDVDFAWSTIVDRTVERRLAGLGYPPRHTRALLAHVSLRIVERNARTTADLTEYLTEPRVADHWAELRFGNRELSPAGLLEALKASAGILKYADGQWDFPHAAWRDLLVAEALGSLQAEDSGAFDAFVARIGPADRDRWMNALRFLTARARLPANIVRTVLKHDADLARRCAVAAKTLPVPLAEALLQEGLGDPTAVRDLLFRIPSQLSDRTRAPQLIKTAASRWRDGDVLYAAAHALTELAGHPETADSAGGALDVLFDHIPSPEAGLFETVRIGDAHHPLWRDVPMSRGTLRAAVVPVTVQQYAAFDPALAGGPFAARRPVRGISWLAATIFCRWLALDPRFVGVRLPSRAEWLAIAVPEADPGARWWCGDAEELPHCAWFADNSGGDVHDVATRRASPGGLYDLHGNVREWCSAAPPGDDVAALQPVCGGSYADTSGQLALDVQAFEPADSRIPTVGFRLVRAVEKAPK